MKNLAAAALAVTIVLAILPAAFAGYRIEPLDVELYPTYAAMGIEVRYDGDDDLNATASFVWRRAGEAEWMNGVDMTWDKTHKRVWASIWPLEQGETIEVKVSFAEAWGSGDTPVLEATGSARTMVLENTGGRTFHVSPDGDDANPGTEAAPWQSLTHATAEVAAGDTVLAGSGVYGGTLLFEGLAGTPEKPIIFAAADGQTPVIDCSEAIDRQTGAWEQIEDDVYVLTSSPGKVFYAARDGLRMYKYQSLDDLKANEQDVPRAWFYDEEADRFYVTTGGTDANEHAYNLATSEFGIHFKNTSSVVVRGFEIRHCGTFGVFLDEDTRGCIILENTIHNSPSGIYFFGEGTTDNAIWKNNIYEKGLLDFSWNAIKASGYPRQGISGKAGRGQSVCWNEISGYFDAIAPVSWQSPDMLWANRDFDLMYNNIYNIGDDAIEVDGGGVNMRIIENRMRNVFVAISLAPIERGPVYCIGNDASYYLLLFKLNVGACTSNGWAYVYHNSGYCLTYGDNYGGTAISFPPGGMTPISNKVFMNNAFILDGLGIRYGSEAFWIDYNCYYNVPRQEGVRFLWEQQEQPSGAWTSDTYENIQAFSVMTGREKHGIKADPMFVDMPHLGEISRVDFGPAPFNSYPQVESIAEGDMHLTAGSPCIDRGALIRGINEDFEGLAPDMGAYEFGGE